jgi:hypothetical protein
MSDNAACRVLLRLTCLSQRSDYVRGRTRAAARKLLPFIADRQRCKFGFTPCRGYFGLGK